MAAKDHLILTAIGPDKVGLVERLSAFISRNNCNIEDSKMAVFCGEFAVIILISGEESNLDGIAKDYRTIESETGLSLSVKEPAARKTAVYFLPYRLTASCMDHSGIVYRITSVLRELDVNIDSLETKTYAAPESGTPLFELEASLDVPARTNIAQLRERLADVQNEHNIDIDLTPIKAGH